MAAGVSSLTENSALIHYDLVCSSCKVTLRIEVRESRSELCPYCGNNYDVQTSNQDWRTKQRRRRLRSRSISATNLPSLSFDSGGMSTLVAGFGNMTLGTLGFNSYFKENLPKLPHSSTGRLVQIGSGNISSDEDEVDSFNEEINYYKYRILDFNGFKNILNQVRLKSTKSEGEERMLNFYVRTFQSPMSLCATFKSDPNQKNARLESSDLDVDFVNLVNSSIKGMKSCIQKGMLKAIVACLIEMGENNSRASIAEHDYTRALYILLQNPIFAAQTTYTILAHLLQHITRLGNSEHQLLVHWFRVLDIEKFKNIVRHIIQFLTIRQFPPIEKSLPPLHKTKWWIPTATKVLALFNAANNLHFPNLVSYTEFYNSALDHMDLMYEYYIWQNPERSGQFSYCQYPFVLSIVAKRHILTKDSEQQMILTARKSLVQRMARHQHPQIEIFFLNITVHRDNLLVDSLNEISTKQKDLKKKLKVSFVGEPGLDMGGLTKEWFQLLIRKIFDPSYGMFVYHSTSRCYWFSLKSHSKDLLREYNLVGVLMGLAVYNSIILDLRFPSICYKKLLTPPVVPYDHTSPVGIVSNLSVLDLAELMPDVSRSLDTVLKYDGDVEEDLVLTQEVRIEEYDDVIVHDLSENEKANEEPPSSVTNANREDFVKKYLNWILNDGIDDKFRAFYFGFHSVCASNALIMLRSEEVETLVCGSPTLDLSELRKVTYYDGFDANDETIRNFWEVLLEYDVELQKKFLLFTTGSDRIPVGGMSEMNFKITKLKDKLQYLPEAHTCFNQLVLPNYKDKDILKKKLTIAISNAEGFGLE